MALVPETAYYLLSKAYQFELPILVFAGLLNSINVLSLLPLILITEPNFFLHIDTMSFEVLFGTGVASALFYIFWSQGIKEISATRAGMLTALCPLMTLVIAALFLGETINVYQMIGMFFVIASVLLSNKKIKDKIK
jgi:drug/metabolite transporter (DMT)-like permease